MKELHLGSGSRRHLRLEELYCYMSSEFQKG